MVHRWTKTKDITKKLNMKKILITRRLLRACEEKASKIFDAKLNGNDELYSQSKLIELSQGCDAILTSITDKMDKDIINKLPNSIKAISNFAVGFGNIDVEAAKDRNIIVTNTPDVLTDATAEIAMLLILGAARRASEGIEYAKNNNWKWSADFLIGKQLTGARLGVLGMGRIGRALPILPIPKTPSLAPVNCFPIKKSADHFQLLFFAYSIPSEALLAAPRISNIAISAVASVKTSGVFVTIIFLSFAASTSIFPNPTAKLEIAFIEFGNLLIISLSILSVIEVKIASHP